MAKGVCVCVVHVSEKREVLVFTIPQCVVGGGRVREVWLSTHMSVCMYKCASIRASGGK